MKGKSIEENIAAIISTDRTMLRKDGSIKQRRAAETLGITQGTLSRILSGQVEDPSPKTIKKLIDYFGVTHGQVMGYESLPSKTEPLEVAEPDKPIYVVRTKGEPYSIENKALLVPLSYLEKSLSAHAAVQMAERNNKEKINIASKNIKHTHIVTDICDDSMYPIPAGTRFVIDLDERPAPGKKVLAKIGNECIIRELREAEEGYRLVPYNTEVYMPKTITDDPDKAKIWGVVIEWTVREY